MPLTKKGTKIRAKMRKTYKSKKKGDKVFYSMENSGKLKGVAKKHSKKRKSR